MATVVKIDSNVTGLRYALETSLGTLPGTPDWYPLEPNSYQDFGGQITTIARNPINPSRQRKKGVTSDLDASGGFNMDLTQTNLVDLLQGFLFANKRNSIVVGSGTAFAITAVDSATKTYTTNSGSASFRAGGLILASGFTNAGNNGLKTIASKTPTTIVTVEALVTEASPPAAAKIVTVGHAGAAGDIDVDASGTWPAITSTALDFTTLGLVPGQWIFVGGDATGKKFVNAQNNGWKRIRSITATRMEFDKITGTTAMTNEASTTETIQLFFGVVIKNESDPTLVIRKTYHLERSMGASDDAQPSQIQYEYIKGATAGQFKINIPTANKINADLSFQGQDNFVRTGAQGPIVAGNRPAITEADAFNTSSDVSRIKLAEVVAGDPKPASNFTYVSEVTLEINNNLTPLKAIGYLGSFDIGAGTFQVSGNIEAYFATVAAADSVRNNKDITLDIILVKANAGIVIDVPLIALGNARANVTQDQAIKLPLQTDAATGAKVNSNMDHTILFEFFDYLPTAADI